MCATVQEVVVSCLTLLTFRRYTLNTSGMKEM